MCVCVNSHLLPCVCMTMRQSGNPCKYMRYMGFVIHGKGQVVSQVGVLWVFASGWLDLCVCSSFPAGRGVGSVLVVWWFSLTFSSSLSLVRSIGYGVHCCGSWFVFVGSFRDGNEIHESYDAFLCAD